MTGPERSVPDPAAFSSRADLADGLTRLRERSGLTVRDVARAVDLPVATAGGYFSGRHLPPLAATGQLVQLLSALGVPEEEVPAWVAAVGRLRRAPGRRPASALAPYRGLAAYQPEDAALFFGREQLTADLVARVAAGPSTPVVVIGSSGSGKSSLLRAGLAAAVVAAGRRAVVTTPGADPATTLSTTVLGEGLGSGDVLVVDQLEELFAPEVRAEEVLAVVERLQALHDDGPAVVLGLRADFFDRALEVEPLARWLAANQVLVGPLSAEALRRVVVQPAQVAGLEVDDALVEVLVAEAGAGAVTGSGIEAGALPLLSHALYVTWLAAPGRRLTLAQYRAVGGLAGAIAQTAETVHAALGPEQLAVERGTLLRLVTVRDGATDTRRPLDHRSFGSVPESEVVAAYVEARLLTSDRGQLQLAHEALLTAWPRLRAWLDADRDGLRARSRLAEATQRWRDAGEDPELLYRGSVLETAVTSVFGSDEPPALTPSEWDFLDRSQAAAARRAATRRRSVRRLRLLAVALAVLAASTGVLAATSVAQNRTVAHARDLAVSRQLAVTAQSLATTDTALAGQVAVAGYLTADTVEARSAVLGASGRTPVSRLAQTDGVINALDAAPDGTSVAAATDSGHVLLVSTDAAPHRLADLTTGPGPLYDVAFSADGRLLAACGDGGRLVVWDVSEAAHPVEVGVDSAGGGAAATATLYKVALSADGSLLAAAAADGTVHLWRAGADGGFGHAATVPAFAGTAQAVALDPAGTLLAAAGSEGLVALWDVTDPTRPAPLAAPFTAADAKITSLDLSPDGTTLAAGSTDSQVHLWDVAAPAAPTAGLTLTGPASWVNAVAFDGDGRALAAASSDKRLWVWDTATGTVLQSFAHPTTLIAAAWAPGATELYSAGADGLVRAWTYPGPQLSGFASLPGQGVFGHDVLATATTDGLRLWDTTDPDEPTLASLTAAPGAARLDGAVDISAALGIAVAGDTSGALHFWDITDPVHPRYLRSVQAHTDWVDTVAFDRSGTRLAASSDDASITLWDLSHGLLDAPTSRVGDLGGFVYTAAFSPDGTSLVASVLTGHVLLLDVGDLAHPEIVGPPVTGPTGYVYSVAFSPDGRTIAASGNDKSVWLWDVGDPAHVTPLGHPLLWADGYATNVAFSPDGRLLAAGMTDGTVRLWDLTDRDRPQRWASLDGIAGTVYGVQFAPDGTHLSAAGADRTVRIWDTSLVDARAEVCTAAARGLAMTGAEWARIAGDVPLPPVCG